jgi:ATP-dependent RNA helicase RhlE
MKEFSELNLSSAIRSNLAKHGFVTPTPVQAQAIPPALEGKDVVATAQTGTGKTLGFALPVMQRLVEQQGKPGTGNIRAVVLSPTRELAIQINETFMKIGGNTGVRTAVVVGGMDESRLVDFLQRRLIDLRGVTVAVLDEADRMLDMGFMPSLKQILAAMPESRQTMLFSATIEKSVSHLVESSVRNPVRIAIGAITKPAEHVDLHVYEIEQGHKMDLLQQLLRNQDGSFLVFSRTKHGADRLARNLERTGVNATRIHGDRTQGQRNAALSGFKEGKFRVLVATDVAARGIHVDGIAHVVNFDLPQVPEDFIHRAGRTGRAGLRGIASTFSTRAERSEIRRIERALNVRMQQLPFTANPANAAAQASFLEDRDEPVVMPIVEDEAPAAQVVRKSFAPKSGGMGPHAGGGSGKFSKSGPRGPKASFGGGKSSSFGSGRPSFGASKSSGNGQTASKPWAKANGKPAGGDSSSKPWAGGSDKPAFGAGKSASAGNGNGKPSFSAGKPSKHKKAGGHSPWRKDWRSSGSSSRREATV